MKVLRDGGRFGIISSMKSIEEHYRELAPKLTNWLVASGSPYNEACDLVQETFLKVWKMKDDLQDNDDAVSGLVFTIARNLRKNYVRDNKRLTFVADMRDADDGGSVDGYMTDGDDGESGQSCANVVRTSTVAPQSTMPSDVAYLRKRLTAAFKELPPILRDAYTLFQVGEMSIAEIARQTGVSENLVKVRIHRAKEKLREILSDLRVTF